MSKDNEWWSIKGQRGMREFMDAVLPADRVQPILVTRNCGAYGQSTRFDGREPHYRNGEMCWLVPGQCPQFSNEASPQFRKAVLAIVAKEFSK